MMHYEGWLPYIQKRPQGDLLLQFTRAFGEGERFIAVPNELPAQLNVAKLYWRLTGIAKAQLEAKGFRASIDGKALER